MCYRLKANLARLPEHELFVCIFRLELHKSLVVPPVDFHFFANDSTNYKYFHGDVLQIAGKVDKTTYLFVCIARPM